MHKCRRYGQDKLNLWPFNHLTFKCDLDLQPTWTNILNGTGSPQGLSNDISTLALNYFEIFKFMHKCRSYGQDKLNLWTFHHLTFKCDLDLQPTRTNVSNGTSTPQGEQLCQTILKSMHKCRSYGPDKLQLWPFYYLTFKCDLNLQPTWINVSNVALLLLKEIILKSMHKCTSYGLDKCGRMYTQCTYTELKL